MGQVDSVCCSTSRVDDKVPISSRVFKPKVITKPIINSSDWNLIFAPTWLTDASVIRRLCSYTSDRACMWNSVHPDLETLWPEADIIMEPGEMLLHCAFYDNRSPAFIVACLLWDKAHIMNKTPEGPSDDFAVDFETLMTIRIWDRNFNTLKTLELSQPDGLAIVSAISCSAFYIYVGDEFGSIHSWEKKSLSNVTKMDSMESAVAKHHDGKVVAIDADPHFCYTMGQDQMVCVSYADGLNVIFKINLGNPMSAFDPRFGTAVRITARSGNHLLRPCSRWAMSQSVPNKRGVTPQGPRGFVFLSAINQDNAGVIMKFVLNRSNPAPLEVQCINAHDCPVKVCKLGPYDNGPLLTVGEDEKELHFWEIHSMQLLMVMNISAPVSAVSAIAVHPQECFYSINKEGQIAIWAFDEFK